MRSPARRLATAVLTVALTLIGRPAAADAQAPAEGRKLTVSSSASVQADPDAAVLSFVVTAMAKTSAEARDDLDKRAKAVTDAIARLKLPDVAVDVVRPPLQPLVAATPAADGSQATEGFHGECQCSVTVRDKDKDKLRSLVTKIGDAVVENGGAGAGEERFSRMRMPRIPGLGGGAEPPEKMPGPTVEWLCENAGPARARAIKAAMDAARASAVVVAGAAPLKEKEVCVHQDTPATRIRLSLALDGATPAAGRVSVDVTVTITFSY